MLAENIKNINDNIQLACDHAQRTKQEITMIAVTKTVGNMEARKIVELGIENLAENRMDKLLEKKVALKDYSNIKWHLIGNLQRRKVKLIINEIDYFHALDSLKLAEEIQKRATKKISCFVEVNVSGENSKHGFSQSEVLPFIKELEPLDKVKIVGLMTMAPFAASKEELHSIFSQLKNLQQEINTQRLSHAPCTELSMGMSNDYPIAIEEGATFIRIGTAVFEGA